MGALGMFAMLVVIFVGLNANASKGQRARRAKQRPSLFRHRVSNNLTHPLALKILSSHSTPESATRIEAKDNPSKDHRGSYLKRVGLDIKRLLVNETPLRILHWSTLSLGIAAGMFHVSLGVFETHVVHDSWQRFAPFALTYPWLGASMVPLASILWNTNSESRWRPISIAKEVDLVFRE